MDELGVDTWIKSGLASKEYQGIEWWVGKKQSALTDRSWFLPSKKLLKPSLLSSPKTTALGYAFIISYLKPALASYLFCASVISHQFILYIIARGIVLKFKDDHILPLLLVLQQLSIACKGKWNEKSLT